jgi:hypothetical protein
VEGAAVTARLIAGGRKGRPYDTKAPHRLGLIAGGRKDLPYDTKALHRLGLVGAGLAPARFGEGSPWSA